VTTRKRNNDGDGTTATFWDHLDVLRGCLIRILAITAVATVVAFTFKDQLFAIVLAPRTSDFIAFRFLGGEPFAVKLMNVDLTEQFMMHMKTACYAGLLVASPYILYSLFRFVAPALYENERRYAGIVVGSSYLMFIIGTALNYFLIFPLTVRFLGTYQVSHDVMNMLTVRSYIDTLITMNLLMGLVFELPVVSWLLAKLGVITARFMSEYRRHAIVAILVLAAIITPTTDVFTLFVVSLPIWLLYEVSIVIVRFTRQQKSVGGESEEEETETSGETVEKSLPTERQTIAEEQQTEQKEQSVEAQPQPVAATEEIQDFGWEDQRMRDWSSDGKE